jgi:hypothetical protein
MFDDGFLVEINWWLKNLWLAMLTFSGHYFGYLEHVLI